MLPLQAIENEVPALNQSWLLMVQRAVRADINRAADFGLSVALANMVDTLSLSDLSIVASTWRSPIFVPRSTMALEGALDRAADARVVDIPIAQGEESAFFLAYMQTITGLCRIDHSCTGERFWLPVTLTRRLRGATLAELATVAKDDAASATVARSATLLERMIKFVTSSAATGPIKPQSLVIMGFASLLAEDSMKVA